MFFQEQANDRLTINGLAGDDVLDAASLKADGIQLTMNGGLGADLFLGSQGDDLINGGDGDDTALMGAGNDVFVWNPGDDNDTIEGQDGVDTLLFNGANINENIDISANGGRVLFSRDVANVTMDLNDVEQIDFNALGGTDNIVVNDLSGTDVSGGWSPGRSRSVPSARVAATPSGGPGDGQRRGGQRGNHRLCERRRYRRQLAAPPRWPSSTPNSGDQLVRSTAAPATTRNRRFELLPLGAITLVTRWRGPATTRSSALSGSGDSCLGGVGNDVLDREPPADGHR